MLNAIWLALILAGVGVAAATGRIGEVTTGATEAARSAVDITIGLAGIMALWLGLVRIAEEAGLLKVFARLMAPVARLLFPSVPPHHPAIGAMSMNLSANLLGLGSAATPLGLKAMQELQKLNPRPEEASPAMITFMALNTSSITLVPATLIAIRAATGSTAPAEIVLPTLLATLAAASTSLALDGLLRWRRRG